MKKKRIFLHKVVLTAVVAWAALAAVFILTLTENTHYTPLQTVAVQQTAPTVLPSVQTQQASTTTLASRTDYIEVLDSCGPYFDGVCVNMRSGPGTEFPVVAKLRTGIVLKVAETLTIDGAQWYKIALDSEVRYPERITSDWFVAAAFVHEFSDIGDRTLTDATSTASTKSIIVYRSQQMLYAYDGDQLFMQEPISSGLEFTPTPRGTFTVYKKTPSRYMQGPLPGISDQYYDLPGVPWNLYFTYQGGVIHGAYWHNKFGQPWSHGCVNLPPDQAKKLYEWADVGTVVIVRD